MRRCELIDDVLEQMSRVWGPEGMDGSSAEYAWLAATCGVTEDDDDVRWQYVFDEDRAVETCVPIDTQDDWVFEMLSFLSDDTAVCEFLSRLLEQYKGCHPYPRERAEGSIDRALFLIHKHARRSGLSIVHALSLAKEQATLVEIDEFLLAIHAERPRVVYWTHQASFNLEEFIEEELRALGWKPGCDDSPDSIWIGPDALVKAVLEWMPSIIDRENSAYLLSCQFSSSGTSCATTFRPSWVRELSSQLRSLILARTEQVNQDVRISESEDASLLMALAAELVANEVFARTRGLNKRLLLAKKLLGDRVPQHRQGQIAKLAQNSEYCDQNLCLVVKSADEQLWLASTLPDS